MAQPRHRPTSPRVVSEPPCLRWSLWGDWVSGGRGGRLWALVVGFLELLRRDVTAGTVEPTMPNSAATRAGTKSGRRTAVRSTRAASRPSERCWRTSSRARRVLIRVLGAILRSTAWSPSATCKVRFGAYAVHFYSGFRTPPCVGDLDTGAHGASIGSCQELRGFRSSLVLNLSEVAGKR